MNAGKQPVSLVHLRALWPDVARVGDALLTDVASEMTASCDVGKINSELRICHFLAQVRQEVGPRFTLSENLNYREAALKGIFLFYRNHPDLARLHAYDPAKKKPADQRAIANHAYANRMGNGNAQSEDGWRYRGRGMIQLTGRENYTLLQSRYAKLWPEGIDFVGNPDLLQEPVYALRSALIFWLRHELFTIADRGTSKDVVDAVTAVVNRHTSSYAARYEHFRALIERRVFAHVV